MTFPTIILLLLFILLQVICKKNESFELEWRNREDYYYLDIKEKVKAIMPGKCSKNACVKSSTSIYGECSDSVNFKIISPDSLMDKGSETMNVINDNISKEFTIIEYPPSAKMIKYWLNIRKPKQMRLDKKLCEASYNIQKDHPLQKPLLVLSKCKNGNYMHDSAPRCQSSYLRYICDKASFPREAKISNGFSIPESDHSKLYPNPPSPFLIHTKNAYVTMCGQIIKPCGFTLLNVGCMAPYYNRGVLAKFLKTCQLDTMERQIKTIQPKYNTRFTCTSNHHVNITRVRRLFVIAEVDDTHLYHTTIEIMPRLIQHLDFLQKNPDVKILYGCDSRPKLSATRVGLNLGLRSLRPLMQLLNLNPSRLIVHSDVYADEVYLPNEGACQDPVYNTWSILNYRQLALKEAYKKYKTTYKQYGSEGKSKIVNPENKQLPDYIKEELKMSIIFKKEMLKTNSTLTWLYEEEENNDKPDKRPVMTVLKRSFSPYTRNKRDNIRQWNHTFGYDVVNALQNKFPNYRVKLFSDTDIELMECLSCQIVWASKTDVLIGVHGAGLLQQLYMKPNAAVVEIAQYPNDGRLFMGGGPFSRLSAIMSHDYLVHFAEFGKETIMNFKQRVSHFDINAFVSHVHNFLLSINKI